MEMKGIILAGGSGTRMDPLTRVVTKQLLPVYDKPMIYYPLSVLMLAGIREVLIISTPADLPMFKKLLGDGQRLGMKFAYKVQATPDGLARAFQIGEDFIGGGPACLILGDNILYGHSLVDHLRECTSIRQGAKIFGYHVNDPQAYGVVELDEQGKALSLEEKPAKPRSPYAVPGLYFYGSDVVERAWQVKPSDRGELEITDLNRMYLERGELSVEILGRGIAWLDAGSAHSLLEASNFVGALEERQGLKIACLEEIAWHLGYITAKQVEQEADHMGKSAYAVYLRKVLEAGPQA